MDIFHLNSHLLDKKRLRSSRDLYIHETIQAVADVGFYFAGGKSNINIENKVIILLLVEGKSNINIENKVKFILVIKNLKLLWVFISLI